MGDYHSERYRRDTWRTDGNRRTEGRSDDDLGDPWDDTRGQRWESEDWQPETSGDSWDEARRRQRLTPGQLSEGGPAPSGYRGQQQGSDLRYGLNGGYGDSPEADEDWRMREQYKSRQYASEYGDYGDLGDARRRGSQGMQRRQGEFGDYGNRGGQQGGFGNADQAWLREAERRSPYRGQSGSRGSGHSAYFNDLRSDTRYWTEPRDEWGQTGGERQPGYHAQRYGRDYLGSRGYDEELGYTRDRAERRWSSGDSDMWRDDDRRRDDDDEDHGMLYNLGHRIGQAVSEWFGPDEGERRTGPRGYTRTDERIRDEICERLTFASGIDVREVSVDVDKGKVTLGGTVHSRGQKYDIEDLADNTFGVTEVENNIRVQRQDVDSAVTASGGFNGS